MKKIIAWLLVLALTAAISIGATLAYLTDTDEDVNVMTVGKVKIDQLEYERVNDEASGEDAEVQQFHDNKPLYPGVYNDDFDFEIKDTNPVVDWAQIGKDDYSTGIWNPEKINNELDKMVFIKNKGTYDAYVRTVFAFEAGNFETASEYKQMVHLNLNQEDWTWEWIEAPVEIPNADGTASTKYFIAVATYNEALAPKDLTEISLSQIALDKSATNADVEAFGDTYQILVKTQAIQADGFTDAATALNDGFGIITANSIPWENDNATKGGTLNAALHYLNADPTGTPITTSVTNIVFGKNAEYPEIVNNYDGYLVDVEQDVPAHVYYVDNSQVTKAATGYTVYVLSDDVIYAPKDSSYLFTKMSNLESVNVEKLNTSRTVNMTEMFQDCAKLKAVDASTWDTSSLTVMDRMFNQCSALQTVNTTGWDLRNVISAERTFRKCVSLESVPGHEKWEMPSVQSAYGLFVTCEKLTTLDASTWDFSSLVNARDLFYGCISLKEVKGLGNWNTGNVESLWDTFGVCKSLETLEGLQNWDVSKVTKFAGTFQQCVKLTDEDVAVMYDWNLDSVTDISWLFKGATGLVNIDLSNWDVSKVTAFNSMFSCVGSNNGSMNLLSAGIENWDTSSATHMGWMFMGCGKMTSIDLSNWNTDNLLHAGHMFADCFKLETVNFDGWTAPKLQTIDAMFNDCRAMKEVDMSDFTMESCFEFSQTFEACYSLERVIGMENWDTSKGCTFVEMFNGCESLKELNWSSFDTHAAYDRYYDLNNSYSNAFNPIFGSVNSLEKLIVSDKISYYGNGNVSEGNKLVFPDPVAKEGYTAKWQNVETGELYLGKEIPEGVAATYVPYYAYVSQGSTLKNALTYLNADSGSTKIKSKITNVTFGRTEDFAEIANNYTGVLADAEQDAPVYVYYVLNGSNYHVYFLSDDNIYAPANSQNLFASMSALKTVDTANFDVSRMTNMRSIFDYCSSLETVDTSSWDTSNVTRMEYAFYGCSKLTALDVSGWDVGNVTTMDQTFYGCKKLTELDVSNWDMSNVDFLYGTFYQCSGLTKLDTSNWDTGKVTNMSFTFRGCTNLAELDVSGWDVGNVTTFTQTFTDCPNLTRLETGNWDTSSAVTMDNMFYGDFKLEYVDVSNWDVSKVTLFNHMFASPNQNGADMALKSIDVSKWNPVSAVNMGSMFYGCAQLTELDMSGWNMPKLENLSHMCADCHSLQEVNLTGWNTPALITVDAMFNHCISMESIDVADLDTATVRELSQMFDACWSLKTIEGMDRWNTSNVGTFTEMFSGCNSLEVLDLSALDTTGARDNFPTLVSGKYSAFHTMFSSMTSLQKLIVSDKISYYGDGTVSEGNKLVLPGPAAKEGYTALWQNVETGELYKASEIPEKTAATYVAYYEPITNS